MSATSSSTGPLGRRHGIGFAILALIVVLFRAAKRAPIAPPAPSV